LARPRMALAVRRGPNGGCMPALFVLCLVGRLPY
jgi:hypothetical protein